MNNSNRIRVERYESRMKECINDFIYHEIYDEKIKLATITYAKLSNDMSIIKFYIDILDRKNIKKIVEYLNERKGLFRTKLAQEFDLRRAPQVIFCVDETFDKVSEIEDIFDNINKIDLED